MNPQATTIIAALGRNFYSPGMVSDLPLTTDSPDGLERPKPTVSFEFFPPKQVEAEALLWQSIQTLASLNPAFVSVTYGAGGSTRELTHRLVKRIREETTLEPAAHLTCVGASRDEIRRIAEDYWQAGIRHIVALRGDPPAGSSGTYQPHPGGYAYADALVEGLRETGDFTISVAAYPQTHPEAVSAEADLLHLKRKFEAGASQAITQYFFDAADYVDFIARARAEGLHQPIIPGILPIANFKQAQRFSTMCGATLPDWLIERFDGVEDAALHAQLAVFTAADLCRTLLGYGVNHLHFYTLNRADLVLAICRLIGIRPRL